MITRRKFLSFLAIILPASWLGVEAMGSKATTVDPKKFKSLEFTGTWVDESGDLRKYNDIILLDQRRQYVNSWVKFDNVNYGVVAYHARAQRHFNKHRSKVLDILSRKA